MQLLIDEGVYRREHFRVDRIHAEPLNRPRTLYYEIYSETVPGKCLETKYTEGDAQRWVDQMAEAWLRQEAQRQERERLSQAADPGYSLNLPLQTITVTKRSHDWCACMSDGVTVRVSDGGPTVPAAIGELVRSWPERFGLKVTVIE